MLVGCENWLDIVDSPAVCVAEAAAAGGGGADANVDVLRGRGG